MTPTDPTKPTELAGPPSRAEQRARDAAERAEFSALLARLRAHQPNFGCFCGTLDDLRRTVADLDRRAPRGRVASTPARVADPQLAARLAAARAFQTGRGDDADLTDRREQLHRWHIADSARGAARDASGGDGDG